nr:hypothetical protein [Tanacetum cinerariifolium]
MAVTDTLHVSNNNVQSSEDVGTYDDDDVNEYFLVDEANEIVKPDVDVHLFGISMDLPFENIGITNLVSSDVLEGDDVDVINADGFDSDPRNDEERNYSKRRRNLKMYKNDSVRIRAKCEGKMLVFTMSQGIGPTGPNRRMKAGPSGSSGPTTRSKKRKNTVRVYPDILVKAVQGQLRELEYSMLRDYVVELQSTNPNTTIKIADERNTDLSLPTRVFQRIYICLGALKLGFRACIRDLLGLDGAFMKGLFLGQVLVAVGLDSNNVIYPLAYALVKAETKSSWYWFLQCLGDDIDLHPNSNFTFINDRQKGIILAVKTVYPSRAKSNLFLNNICKVFNGKIVEGKDKPVITLLEYIREYCMKRIVNVQCMIDKCTGPLTHTATRIMESIKKEAHVMKVQWNKANKYQVSGRPTKEEKKRSKHKDEPFVKDGKPSRKGRTIRCQSCRNTRHNKATCKGQGRKATTGGNNAEGSGSASRQVQQTEPAVGQDGSGGSGTGAVIGLYAAASEGGAGVASQGSSHTRWTRRRVQTKRISPQKRTPTQPVSQPSTSFKVPMSQTRNAYGRETGDGIPTQSSAPGGASEWTWYYPNGLHNYQLDYFEMKTGFGCWWLSQGLCEDCCWMDDEDYDSDLLIPTPCSDESKNEKGQKGGEKNSNGKDPCLRLTLHMPSEAVEQGMDATVPDEIDGARGERVLNHVVKKGNLEFLVFKEVGKPGVNELVDTKEEKGVC